MSIKTTMKSKIINSLIHKIVSPPGRFAGGFILNLFGYHVFRILLFNLPFILKNKITLDDSMDKEVLEQIEKDGIAVINDFFPQDVFLEIKKEYDQLNIEVVNERRPYMKRSAINRGEKHLPAPRIEKYITNNPFINRIVPAASRKKISIVPKVQVERGLFYQEDLGKPTTDQESNNLHFDVSYPTFKCFLYMTDTDKNNAAFTYVKGSQKMTLARLWMEYKMSVLFWFREAKLNITPEVSHAFIEKQGMKITPMIGKSNTLVIANTMGFHRRGDYLTTTPRQLIIMNYRDLDSLKLLRQKLFEKR